MHISWKGLSAGGNLTPPLTLQKAEHRPSFERWEAVVSAEEALLVCVLLTKCCTTLFPTGHSGTDLWSSGGDLCPRKTESMYRFIL